jgi:hypothetical protein
VLSNGYSSQLNLGALPESVASAVKSSVAGGVAVAKQLGSPALLDEVRSAFIHGMDIMLWTCGGIAVASALLALAFLPRRSGPGTGAAGAVEPALAPEAAALAPREPTDSAERQRAQ